MKINIKHQKSNTRRKTPTPRLQTCQWMEGVCRQTVSAWFTCHAQAVLAVESHGMTLGHVCAAHSRRAADLGFQLRKV